MIFIPMIVSLTTQAVTVDGTYPITLVLERNRVYLRFHDHSYLVADLLDKVAHIESCSNVNDILDEVKERLWINQ